MLSEGTERKKKNRRGKERSRTQEGREEGNVKRTQCLPSETHIPVCKNAL